MIILIHGNGLIAISKKISEIKAKFDPLSIQEFSGKQISFEQAKVQFATGGLFSDEKLVVLEEFDEKIDLENLGDESTTIILKYSKNLPSNSVLLKNALEKSVQVINLTEAQEENIFPFLDKLADKNPRALDELDKWLGQTGGQYLLTMIFYMLRRMIAPSKKSSSFMLQKITKQKQNFPPEKIAQLYKEGLETDYKIKNGLLNEKMGITLWVNSIVTPSSS